MLFFEAFENLTCDNELRKLYNQTEVVRVVASKKNNTLSVYLKSNRIIHWSNLKKMEELLNKQLFLHTGNKACIIPLFELTEKYELERLFAIYRDSILDELRDISIVTYHLITQSETRVKDNTIIIRSKESCIAEDKFEKLKAYLVQMFRERFGYEIAVKCEYIKTAEKRKLRLPAFLRSDEDDDEDQEYDMPHYDFTKRALTLFTNGNTHCNANRYAGGVG